MGNISQVFISYSWDSKEHKSWVRTLSKRLRADGIDAILDETHLPLGGRTPEFMERSVRESRWVLVVCTENYKRRFDNREGGAGYEGHIITGEMVNEIGKNKFIPILRSGNWKSAVPTALSGVHGIDLRNDSGEEYSKLLKHLLGISEIDPVGPQPRRRGRSSDSSNTATVTPDTALDAEKFWEQRIRLPRTDIVTKIWSKPRWRIWIRPTAFMEARFRDLSHCKQFVCRNVVEYANPPDSPYYPFYLRPELIEQDPSGRWIAHEIESPEETERWVLFQSGQFVHNLSLPEIKQLGNSLPFQRVVKIVSQVFEFAARMAHEGLLSPDAFVKVELEQVAGYRLLCPGSSTSCWSKEGSISVEVQLDPKQLEARSRELALDTAMKILKKFGWTDVPRSLLEEEQARLR